jgi:hypothetical protein
MTVSAGLPRSPQLMQNIACFVARDARPGWLSAARSDSGSPDFKRSGCLWRWQDSPNRLQEVSIVA